MSSWLEGFQSFPYRFLESLVLRNKGIGQDIESAPVIQQIPCGTQGYLYG